MGNNEVSAKNKTKVKFNKKSVSIKVGKKTTIKLKSARAKVKWKVKNKKVVKIVNKKGKYNNLIIIKGKKKGKTALTAKYKRRKYKIEVKVNSKTIKPQNNVNQSVVDTLKPSIVAKSAVYDDTTKKLNITYLLSNVNKEYEPAYCPGESGILEMYNNGKWEKVSFKEGISFQEYLVRFSENGFNVANIDIGYFYGDLVGGKYRYTIKFTTNSGGVEVPVEFEVHEKQEQIKMEITNAPIKMSENGISINVKIINNTNEDYHMDYAFGKLERYEDGEWKSLDAREMVSIEIIGLIDKKSYLLFTIGLNGKGGETFGHIDNLATGHYRYTHTINGGQDTNVEYVTTEFDIVE